MKVCLFACFVLVSASLHAQLADFQHKNFHRADSLADANFGAPVTDLAALSGNLTHSLLHEEEKFRAIYKWVCNNISFDYEVFRINREKRDKFDTPEALKAWNKKLTPVVFRHLVEEKKTVCTGYAWLVQQLAQHAGISCMIVDGYGRNATVNVRKNGKPNHSWNAVKLNNKWYLCDATWASGAYDADREVFVKKYDDSYFLADPNVFVRNHYPVDTQWTLLETGRSKLEVRGSKPETDTTLPGVAPTLTEFLNGPLIYSSAYRHNITQLYPATFDVTAKKSEAVSFRFASDQPLEQAEFSVHRSGKVQLYRPEFSKNPEGLYCLKHTFAEKGRHIVHVLLNDSYAFTYTVTVR
jgi:hypothetical protein